MAACQGYALGISFWFTIAFPATLYMALTSLPTHYATEKSHADWPSHHIAHQEPRRGADPAGLDIHGQLVEVDIGSQYDSYKTFEIEFESPSGMSSPPQQHVLELY